MEAGLGWLMRPVENKLIQYREIHEPGHLTLWDIRLLNQTIDVREENAARARKAAEKK